MTYQTAYGTIESIRPISDLRTHLAEIEEEAKRGPVILNRNGKPALVLEDADAVLKKGEIERHKHMIREGEIWQKATGGKSYTAEESKKNLTEFIEKFEQLLRDTEVEAHA